MAGTLKERLPTIRPAEVRSVTTYPNGEIATSSMRLVPQQRIARPMYRVEVVQDDGSTATNVLPPAAADEFERAMLLIEADDG